MKLIAFVIVFLFSCWGGFCQNIPENVVLKRLDNTNVRMGEVLGEDVVIVTFWATWCKPCQNELEALVELQDEWKGKVRFLAVSIDDSRSLAKVKSLVKGKKWPCEVLLDSNKELYKALNLTSIPFVMIVADGKTLWSHTGYRPGDEESVLEKALTAREKRMDEKLSKNKGYE